MYLISFILIFIESTIGAIFLTFIVTLPFLMLLIKKNIQNGLKYSFLFSIIYSIQNNSFIYYFIFFICYSVGSMLLLNYLEYEKKNIFFFTLFQICIISLFFWDRTSVFPNFLGCLLTNYLYLKKFRRKKKV